MKWINPGVASLYTKSSGVTFTVNSSKDKAKKAALASPTGYATHQMANTPTVIEFSNSNIKELWISFNPVVYQDDSFNYFRALSLTIFTAGDASMPIMLATSPNAPHDTIDFSVYRRKSLQSANNESLTPLYDAIGAPTLALNNTSQPTANIEVHVKTGESSRIDVWYNTKLAWSYRSPNLMTGDITSLEFNTSSYSFEGCALGPIIIQDTRRIGLEKFKKLTIDPDTEQNMPQGSTTTYKLSGLSDATEFSDITSVCAVLQATSRDANITTGTFTLDGNNIGTIDVSDSSGKAYEIAHSETNSATGKSWTAADIEGKTLSFKVNGAE